MRIALALLAWLLLLAHAGDLRAPQRVEVDDGAFLSLPLEVEGEAGSLELEYPAGFKPLSLPDLHPGRLLVNFFVDRGVRSGEYRLTFKARGDDGATHSASCLVFVRPRAEFAVETPPGKEVLLGSRVRYWIGVVNSGNVDDVVSATVRMPERDATIEPAAVELSAGQRGGFLLTLQPRYAQPLVVVLELRSRRNPEMVKYVSVRTDVLPFAGAGDLGERSLRYQLGASGGSGSDGWKYGLQARIGGSLSDYVFGVASASYAPGRPRMALDFSGDWGRLGFTAASSAYETHAAAGDLEGRLRLASGLLSGSLSWKPGPWRLALSGNYGHQRFSIGGALPLGGWLRLEPRAFLDRYDVGGGVYLEPGGEVYLLLDSPNWLMSTRLSYQGGVLSAGGEVSRRRSQDYSLRGYWFYSGGALGANLEAGEALGGSYWLSQGLSFLRGGLGWRLGLRYAEEGVPWSFGLGVRGTDLSPGGYGTLSYRQASWESTARLDWSEARGLKYSLSTTFQEEGSKLTLSFAAAAEKVLGVKLNHVWEAWEVTGNYDLSLDSGLGSGMAEISYDLGGWTLKSGVRGDAYEIKWWLTGALRLEGGFATPEEVVQTFGGRKSGRVWGVVFVDENKNGSFDPGEKPVSGAYLSCGSTRALSGADGDYGLESEPGRCRLSVQDPEGRYGLPEEVELDFVANGDRRLDLGLVPVAGVSGYVWLDENENRARDEGEHTLAGVEVVLLGPDGFTATTWSDAHGRFSISYLPPGRYQISLGTSGLARLQQPGEPLEMELQPGPLPFVGLAAVPRELRQVQTFTQNDAAIYVDLARQTAPPGADLPLRVTVSGMGAASVYVESGGHREELEPLGDGEYAGYLHVPENAAGAFFYRVVARSDAGEVEQEAMLVVRPGSLARLTVQPAFVDPGAPVSVTASLLKRVEAAEVVFGGKAYPLRRQDDLTWTLQIEAPAEPGRYSLELWVGGKKWAEAAFRVAE